MDQLRKAGAALAGMDRAYANKIAGPIDPHKQPLLELGSAVPIADALHGGKADTPTEKALLAAMNAGVAGMNVASRYALPAGGVTLAGKALIDLTAQFGGPADGQEPNQLSM